MKRDRVLDAVRKYIDSEPIPKFVPGETKILSSGATWDADDMVSLVNVALDRWYGGKASHEFERFMATAIGQRYVTLCNSGSSANLLALTCLMSSRLKGRALKKGDEVITVAAGFPTTVNPIIQNGLIPVFVDTNLPGYNALPNAISEAISDKTKAIFMAHTLGNPYRAKEIRELADQNDLFIIADCCFVAGTKIKTDRGDVDIEKIKTGDMVLTRRGYRKVIGNKKTGLKRVIQNIGLTGTPDHPVITPHGVKRLDTLSASDIIYVWNQNQSSITALSIREYQTLLSATCESTTGEGIRPEETRYTDKFTKTTTERYQAGISFITLMKTHLTMTLPILRRYQESNTLPYTSTSTPKTLSEKTLNLLEKRRRSGTEAERDTICTSGSEKILGRIKRRIRQFAERVERVFKPIFQVDRCTAHQFAKTEEEVYNLAVDGEHEYFANNVLVHNCDALGSEHHGKPLPFWADISTFSFFPAHHISTAEGGAVSTNDSLLNSIIRSFRDWGRACWCDPGKNDTCGKRYGWQLGDLPMGFDHKYIYSEIGYNLKATDLQAALGISQIKKLPKFIQTRRDNWSFYRERLGEFREHLIFPEPTAYSNPSWFGFAISIKEKAPFSRTDLISFLSQSNIDSRMLFAGNIVRHPAYREVKHRVSGTLHKSDFVTNNTFWIGVAPVVTRPMQNYVVEKFAEFLKRYR